MDELKELENEYATWKDTNKYLAREALKKIEKLKKDKKAPVKGTFATKSKGLFKRKNK